MTKEFLTEFERTQLAGAAATYLTDTITGKHRGSNEWKLREFEVLPKKGPKAPVPVSLYFQVNIDKLSFRYKFRIEGKGIAVECEDVVGLFAKLAKVAKPA